MCIEGDVRLGVGNLTRFYASINDVEDYYFIKDELARSRVEVFVDRTYGTILCDDFWARDPTRQKSRTPYQKSDIRNQKSDIRNQGLPMKKMGVFW